MHVFCGHMFLQLQMHIKEAKKRCLKMKKVLTSGEERGKRLGLAGRVDGTLLFVHCVMCKKQAF